MSFLLILRESVDQTAEELTVSSQDPREKLAPSVMSNLLLTLWHKRSCPEVNFFFLPSSLSPGTQGLFWVVAWVVVTLYQGILCFWQVPIMLWISALKALNQADNSFYINQTTTIFNNFPSSWDWICTSDLCIRDITNPQRHSAPWLCCFPTETLASARESNNFFHYAGGCWQLNFGHLLPSSTCNSQLTSDWKGIFYVQACHLQILSVDPLIDMDLWICKVIL